MSKNRPQFRIVYKHLLVKVNLTQGSQTQSVSRAAWDWKQGLAGRIKKWRKIFELISNVFEKIDQLAQYFF